MKNLNLIAEELFNKIRGRFPSVTLGDTEGKVTNIPTDARFFDFEYKEGDVSLGKVSVSLSENSVEIMYSDSFVSEQDEITKQNWYNFLKEIRQFSKKRLMTFDTRNINKSNLDKRDYKFLAQNRGDETMSESKMYGTNRVSYQKVDGARIVVKHNESINTELAGGRTRSIGKIYIESAEGERFMYPFKHLSGARAMARHVAEGGKPFDEFGTHIVGLSEEMNKLRKFKNYMGRSAVMAESLAGYSDVVNDRIKSVKKTIESLQKPKFYAETIGSFEASIMEDVPADVKENWIDQLTIKQFNEELSDVFPYIYKLVSEATRAKGLTPDDLLGEGFWGKLTASSIEDWAEEYEDGALGDASRLFLNMRSQYKGSEWEAQVTCRIKSFEDFVSIKERMPQGANGQPIMPTEPSAWQEVNGNHKCAIPAPTESFDSQLETSLDGIMGQFAEAKEETMVCKDCGDEMHKPTSDCKHDCDDEGGSWWTAKSKTEDAPQEAKEQQIPVTEFVLSMFDRETGQFPKGETAILTAIEKDYGESYINPGKAFIEAINAKFNEYNAGSAMQEIAVEEDPVGTVMEPTVEQDDDLGDIRRLSGI